MGGKFRISGSSTGNTYDKTPKGIVCYNRLGKRIHINVFLKEENVTYKGNGVFLKKQPTAQKAPSRKLSAWDKAKAVGRGAVKSVTNMFTDENGKFSLKQTAKTVATAVGVTVGAAVVVALGAPVAAVTTVVVGTGALIGAFNVADGINQVSKAETAEEELKGYETIGEGTGEIGLSLLMRKGISKALKKARAASMSAKRNALANGSGKTVANMKGVAAAIKSTVPGKKEIKETANALRHPIKTFKQVHSANKRIKVQKNGVKNNVKGAKTQEDIAQVRQNIAENEVLSAKEKAALNKKLDAQAKNAPHEEFSEIRSAAESSSDINSPEVKAYYESIKRSTNREALNDIVQTNKYPEDVAVAKIRLSELDAMEMSSAKTAIDNATMKQVKGFKGLINRLRGKKSEADQLRVKIENEVHDPAMKAELLQKIDAKEALINDINSIKHPTKQQYADFIKRADDEVVLQMLEQKLMNDTGFFRAKTSKSERTGLYNKLFEKQHQINPEKYPELNAGKELKTAKRDLEANKNSLDEKRWDEINAKRDNDNAIEYDRVLEDAQNDAIGYQRALQTKRQVLQDEIAQLKARAQEKRSALEASKKSQSAKSAKKGEQNVKAEKFIEKAAKDIAKEMAKDQRYRFKSEAERIKIAKEILLKKNFGLLKDRNGAKYSKIIRKYQKDFQLVKDANTYKATVEEGNVTREQKTMEWEITGIEETIRVKEQELQNIEIRIKTNHENIGDYNGLILEQKGVLKETGVNLKSSVKATKQAREDVSAGIRRVRDLQKSSQIENPNVTPSTYIPGFGVAFTADLARNTGSYIISEVDEGTSTAEVPVAEEVVGEEIVGEEVVDNGTPATQGSPSNPPDDNPTADDDTTDTPDDDTPTTDDVTTGADDGTSTTPSSDNPVTTGKEQTGDNKTGGKTDDNPITGSDTPVTTGKEQTGSDKTGEKTDDAPVAGKKPGDDKTDKTGNNKTENRTANDDTEESTVNQNKARSKYKGIQSARVTLTKYIEGIDENGNKTDISPAQKGFIAQQIQCAKTEGDIALIYSELRTFKSFKGRKQILKQLKAQRKAIQHKTNLQQTNTEPTVDNARATKDLDAAQTATKKRSFFKQLFGIGDKNPYLLDKDFNILDLDT